MPIRVQDIIDQGITFVQEGTGIIHVHAYDEHTCQQKDDWQIYARIIEGLRQACYALVYQPFHWRVQTLPSNMPRRA